MRFNPRCLAERLKPQFRLRSLLLATTAFCLWLGWLVDSTHRQRHAVERIHANGGRVRYESNYVPYGMRNEGSTRTWAQSTFGIDWFTDVVEVYCLQDEGSDVIAAETGNLPQVKVIHLHGAAGDEALRHICDLKNVQRIIAIEASVTASGVKTLRRMRQLESLSIESTLLTDAAIDELNDLPMLKRLLINDCRVSKSAMKQFADAHPDCVVTHNGRDVPRSPRPDPE